MECARTYWQQQELPGLVAQAALCAIGQGCYHDWRWSSKTTFLHLKLWEQMTWKEIASAGSFLPLPKWKSKPVLVKAQFTGVCFPLMELPEYQKGICHPCSLQGASLSCFSLSSTAPQRKYLKYWHLHFDLTIGLTGSVILTAQGVVGIAVDFSSFQCN